MANPPRIRTPGRRREFLPGSRRLPRGDCGPGPASRDTKKQFGRMRWAIALDRGLFAVLSPFRTRWEQCTLTQGQADRLDRELPKNGDVPNSPLTERWQPGAVGRHNFKLKIKVGSYHRCHWRRFSYPTFGRWTAMQFRRRQFLRLAAGAAALPAVARMARAQTYPVRPGTLVVPFAAGGITDVVARLTAGQLQTSLKQPFLVENQPGGAGILAANRVAKATPDGYLLLFTPIFQITMAPFTHTVT